MAEAEWRKSSYSGGQESDCLEVAPGRVRDSKNPGPVLDFSRTAFAGFVAAVKDSRFTR
ncbi:DUF397 domain-containing protein [Lentzea tibetensis]|uniref:DUF397 domain-containing protein n=1 Tax=Lentzea tibetensis TaxID=2591470 RepID=A0A563ESI0_9PSEU|nr:DUF397 domain-containing protein [Lentzea tibetensis]TWP50626.1 DUF397 domain-containing protein [Lentzea tibetensis]